METMEGINVGEVGYNDRHDEERENIDLSPELKSLFDKMAISGEKINHLDAAFNKVGLTLEVLNSPVEEDKDFIFESLSLLAYSADKTSEDRIINKMVEFLQSV